MKQILTVLLSVLLFARCGGESVLHDSNGKSISSRDWQGKWVIVNYWADWCEGCRLEIPQLNTFYRQNHDPAVVMYAVNFDGLRGNALRQSVKKMGFAFPVLVDGPAPRWSLPAPDVLPVTYIIGPDGQLRRTLSGAQTEALLKQALQQLQQH